MESPDLESTVQVNSLHYGSVEVSNKQIYHFPQGIIGFSAVHQYALVPIEETDVYALQALKDDLSFIVIPAASVDPGYGIEVDDDTIALLTAENTEDIVPFLIVNMMEDKLHVNLKAPLLLVPSARKGCQYIAANSDYPLRHPLPAKES